MGFSGTISAYRHNGIIGSIQYHITVYDSYYYLEPVCIFDRMDNGAIGLTVPNIEPCIFKYNDKWYFGLKCIASSALFQIFIDGMYNTRISDSDPFAVRYYAVNTSTVINQEIYSTISTTDIRKNDIYLNQIRNNLHIASSSTKTLIINYNTILAQSNIANYFPGYNAILMYTLGGGEFSNPNNLYNTAVLFFIGRPTSDFLKLHYPNNCPVIYTNDTTNHKITIQCDDTALVMGYIII